MKLESLCKFDRYVLVISGFCYITDSSGTSKVVKAHEEIFNESGIDYIVLHPMNPRGIYTKCYGVVVNGKYYGVRTYKEILFEIVGLNKYPTGILIHHIINTEISNVKLILEIFKDIRIVFYLHDFYSYCINPKMLKDDRYFCAYENVNCCGCKYQNTREKHFEKINEFFKYFEKKITFVSPSDFTKKIWINLFPQYKEKVVVIPHLTGIGVYYKNKICKNSENPLKIGYVGAQNYAKGWEIFKKCFSTANRNGCDYRYFSFGKANERIDGIVNIDVQIHLQGKNAMIEALRNNEIDVVFLCSVCPETYSYTLYESMAANCFIVTTEFSGNIATVIKKEGFGCVFSSIDDLERCFSNEECFKKMINEWKQNKIYG